MNDKAFESLPEEKRRKIIDASLEEFALNGYDKASTNSIVKKADISKGILFYYFGSKKELFLYIFDYTIEYLLSKYYTARSEQPSDIFERLVWLSMYKMRMVYENPLMSRLLYTAVINVPKELEREITERYNAIFTKNMSLVLEGIDKLKFKKDIDPNKAIEIISLCMDGLANKYIRTYRNKSADELFSDIEKIMEEFNEYIEIIKYGIYEGKK